MRTRETVGVDPKVWIQALVTLIVFFAAKFGVELDTDVAAALATLVGAVAAYSGPAATTRPVTR